MSSSSIITRVPATGHDFSAMRSPLPHPGEHLREDYLPDHGLTAEELAEKMGLPDPQPVIDLVAEKIELTADLALRLGRLFNQSPDMWLGLQADHDLSKAAIAKRDELSRIKPLVVTKAA